MMNASCLGLRRTTGEHKKEHGLLKYRMQITGLKKTCNGSATKLKSIPERLGFWKKKEAPPPPFFYRIFLFFPHF